MQYRRAYIQGSSYFFTLVTEQRRKLFIDETNVDLLYQAFRHVMKKRPFAIDAIVVLPEHLHCIWTLPPNDADFCSSPLRLIKTWFTKHCDNEYKVTPNQSRFKKNEQAIWQHRYWEHLLRDELDFEHHINYIHYNPVKHDYVNKPSDWKYSSFHRYVEQGTIPINWGASDISFPDGIGNE
jgi:putative transposase